jgi:hypothetical protein
MMNHLIEEFPKHLRHHKGCEIQDESDVTAVIRDLKKEDMQQGLLTSLQPIPGVPVQSLKFLSDSAVQMVQVVNTGTPGFVDPFEAIRHNFPHAFIPSPVHISFAMHLPEKR